MMSSADRRRRPRRFFGLRGVVRRLRRPDAGAGDTRRPGRQSSVESDRALQSERARFAAGLDLELRLACRNEATLRRELGCAARVFASRRAYGRLGFVRLSDYARERLGVSARTLQSAAWLATRLDELPAVSRAYDRSELSWAQARAICRVAVATDEERWLEVARGSTVETLERLVARAGTGQPGEVPADPEGEPNEIDGEPAIRWRFVCPARVRALWRHALELASRVAGEPLSDWRAAEVVAAEGSSGRPPGMSIGDRVLLEAMRLARRARRRRSGGAGEGASSALVGDPVRPVDPTSPTSSGNLLPLIDTPMPASSGDPARPVVPPPSTSSGNATDDGTPPAPTDPFALDARLVEAMRALRTTEPRIGRLLRVVVDHRFYRSFGYPAFDDYVRERLGISVRKAWALLKLEKATLRSDDFGRAYREGRISWVRALALLPVLDPGTAPAWIARAESVTVRRLCDEVDWVLGARDALGPSVSLGPPPVDSRLPSPLSVTSPEKCRDLSPGARLQIRAHEEASVAMAAALAAAATHPDALFDGRADLAGRADVAPIDTAQRRAASEICDAEIRFTGPTTVIALLRDVLDAFAETGAPRWTALERLLRHVVVHWESTPRHHDPVFARDGWRCTVPACSSRRNLHDHHIRFRSRGGDNRRDNRTVVCAAHHLHGLHDGTIHASGVAPHATEWRLGVRPGAPPFLAYIGDRYRAPDTAGTAAASDEAALRR